MPILVAYLATPGGADAVALGARLARSLPHRAGDPRCVAAETVAIRSATTRNCSTDRAESWLAGRWTWSTATTSPSPPAYLLHESSAEGIITEAESSGPS